jgi:colicin import membrane protein
MTADRFSRDLAISLGLHAAVVLLIFFKAVLIPSEPIDLRNAIRVDMVDLPRKMETLPEPAKEPAPTVPEKPKELPPKPEAAPVKTATPPTATPKAPKANVEKAQNNALNRIKAMSALDKIRQDVKAEKEKASKPKPDVVRGNQVSAGNSLTGLERIEYDHYFDMLKGKVLSQFNLPQWLADQGFKAQVLVLIDERGYIVKRQIKVSSGNDIFDTKVLEAVDASSPLEPPPARLRGLLSTAGIVLRFPQQ